MDEADSPRTLSVRRRFRKSVRRHAEPTPPNSQSRVAPSTANKTPFHSESDSVSAGRAGTMTERKSGFKRLRHHKHCDHARFQTQPRCGIACEKTVHTLFGDVFAASQNSTPMVGERRATRDRQFRPHKLFDRHGLWSDMSFNQNAGPHG